MQVLKVKQALPALPPKTHAGSIDARSLGRVNWHMVGFEIGAMAYQAMVATPSCMAKRIAAHLSPIHCSAMF